MMTCVFQDTMANNAGGGENEDEADVPMAQRRRFTRVEMARVLMERNQYKVWVRNGRKGVAVERAKRVRMIRYSLIRKRI